MQKSAKNSIGEGRYRHFRGPPKFHPLEGVAEQKVRFYGYKAVKTRFFRL